MSRRLVQAVATVLLGLVPVYVLSTLAADSARREAEECVQATYAGLDCG